MQVGHVNDRDRDTALDRGIRRISLPTPDALPSIDALAGQDPERCDPLPEWATYKTTTIPTRLEITRPNRTVSDLLEIEFTVDDEDADGLVAEMMKRLAQVFADERSRLEEQWSRGDDISTEDLRQALHRYRSFMDRLLSV